MQIQRAKPANKTRKQIALGIIPPLDWPAGYARGPILQLIGSKQALDHDRSQPLQRPSFDRARGDLDYFLVRRGSTYR